MFWTLLSHFGLVWRIVMDVVRSVEDVIGAAHGTIKRAAAVAQIIARVNNELPLPAKLEQPIDSVIGTLVDWCVYFLNKNGEFTHADPTKATTEPTVQAPAVQQQAVAEPPKGDPKLEAQINAQTAALAGQAGAAGRPPLTPDAQAAADAVAQDAQPTTSGEAGGNADGTPRPGTTGHQP